MAIPNSVNRNLFTTKALRHKEGCTPIVFAYNPIALYGPYNTYMVRTRSGTLPLLFRFPFLQEADGVNHERYLFNHIRFSYKEPIAYNPIALYGPYNAYMVRTRSGTLPLLSDFLSYHDVIF